MSRFPRFLHEHFAYDSRLLVHRTGAEGMHAFSLFKDKILRSYDEPDGFTLPGKFDFLYGPCSGVFLVTISMSNKLALWNPATMKLRPLSSPQDFDNEVDHIGFMIDHTNEFKIVVIHGYSLNESESCHYALYKSRDNSWRYFEDEALHDSTVKASRCRSTLLHGWCYWMKYSRKSDPKHYKLLAFDLNNEAFLELEIPEAAQLGEDTDLAIYRESIALHSYQATNNRLDIWWLEERGIWTLVHRLNMSEFRTISTSPLGFWRENIIFDGQEDLILIAYDLKSHEKTVFGIGKREGAVCNEISIFQYKESRVSLKDEARGIIELDTQCAEARDFFSTKIIQVPDDIKYRILLRLPVITLLRFVILSHKWQATIASQHFVREHFSSESNQTRLLVCYNASVLLRGGHAFSLFNNETLKSYEEPVGFTLAGNFTSLYGPSNGVFLVTINTNKKLALWNPATRRLRPLPSPQDFDSEHDALGFMVDPTSLLFKIVLIHGYNISGSEPHHCSVYTSSNNSWKYVSVYTSSNNSWKYVEDQALRHSFIERGTCGNTLLDGWFYWSMWSNKSQKYNILAFDTSTEEFQEIEIPVVAHHNGKVEVATYKGMLALLSFNYDSIDIWLKAAIGLWTMTFKLNVPSEHFMAAVGFWEDYLVYTLINSKERMKVVLHALNSQRKRGLRIAQGDEKSSYLAEISIFHYKESLVSLKDEALGIKELDIQSA